MLEVDLHSHTIFSECGIHTHIEMMTKARELGLKALAITDHGPALNARLAPPFFDRLRDPVPGITMLKGMECNLHHERPGEIDLPKRYTRYLDVVLVGLHPNIPLGLGVDFYTDLLLQAIQANPCIDIITHPNEREFPLDFDRLASVAALHGVALELNNSKTLYNRTDPALTTALINACKRARAPLVVNSDAHAIAEIGLDDSVRPYIERLEFPEELWVNSSAPKAFAFMAERKKSKI